MPDPRPAAPRRSELPGRGRVPRIRLTETPFRVADHIGPEILESVLRGPAPTVEHMPLWCPWPLPPGWMVTGVGWAGDDRIGVRATALACSGPDPLGGGPADIVIVAEQPGVGLGNRFAGIPGTDPGYLLAE